MASPSSESTGVPTPASSPIPVAIYGDEAARCTNSSCKEPHRPDDNLAENNNQLVKPVTRPCPKLRLHFEDLTHSATKAFITHIPDPHSVLQTALSNILTYLYTSPPNKPRKPSNTNNNNVAPCYHPPPPPPPAPHFDPCAPGTRSVTLILRAMSGVAYTTGTRLDSDHKEIHFSLSYIDTAIKRFADPSAELVGVITHELVHCYQHTTPSSSSSCAGEEDKAKESAAAPYPPSGLIEGIADFIRLKAGLVPPHWKRPVNAADRAGKWDQGYQHTAFFLEWLEDVRVGTGAVGMLNDRLLRTGYVGEGNGEEGGSDGGEEEGNESGDDGNNAHADKKHARSYWKGLFGVGVLELWNEYGEYLDGLE
ncbi:hypothetical protein AJ80_07089 [Polytolypa hystricis UAMH7299]|uniref:PBSP domain-containing protein n=1 Tax=Polytolypa hystricis (strain UAMH7299) TaxID=1447883 RepID=A0A2B7XRY3_POLH7|nr:hypothetical protein AJ80_07089 [Polytolypa hystricis UAMH7299]